MMTGTAAGLRFLDVRRVFGPAMAPVVALDGVSFEVCAGSRVSLARALAVRPSLLLLDYRREVTAKQIDLMHKRGIWTRPDRHLTPRARPCCPVLSGRSRPVPARATARRR